MKKLLLAALVLLSGACTNETMEIQDAVTRSVIDEESVTNPNLTTDWEHQDEIVLSNGKKVASPWGKSSSIVANVDFANDVKKEDGWIMLYHTFKDLNAYPDVNYILLYNELTGFMKVFYYNQTTAISPNGGLWYFRCMNGVGTSLFNLNDYIALPDNATNKNSYVSLSNALEEPSKGFQPGWNGFEMEIPYTKDYVNLSFSLSTYNQSITSYTFSGTTESQVEGTIVKTMSQNKGIFKAISTLGGQGAKSLIGKLKTKVDNGIATDTTGTIKAKLGTKIVNALSKVSSEGYKDAILSGLKYIFGSNMVTETQQVHLTTNGTIHMDGSSITTSTGAIYPIGNLNWYEIASVNNPRPEGRYFGVWTLKDTPVVRISRYSKIFSDRDTWVYNGRLQGPSLVGSPVVEVEINPNLQPYITNTTVSKELICCERLDNKDFDHLYFSRSFGSELIYSDRMMTLVEAPVGKVSFKSSLCEGYGIAEGYDPVYDWGTEDENNMLLIVTVELTYNYKGKSHTIVSSRPYRPKCIMDESLVGILTSGPHKKAYAVNTKSYPLENRRDD